jgi:hypothetical protein
MVFVTAIYVQMGHNKSLPVVIAAESVRVVPDRDPAFSSIPVGCFRGINIRGLDEVCPGGVSAVHLLGNPDQVFQACDLVGTFGGPASDRLFGGLGFRRLFGHLGFRRLPGHLGFRRLCVEDQGHCRR